MINKQALAEELARVQNSKEFSQYLLNSYQQAITKSENKSDLKEYSYWQEKEQEHLEYLNLKEKLLQELINEK